MIEKIKQTAKAWVGLITAILTGVAASVPASWAPWVAGAIAIAGAIGTWATPNAVAAYKGDGEDVEPDEEPAEVI